VAQQKLRGIRIIRRDDDVSRGSNNVDEDECCASCERSVGKVKNDRSSSSPPSLFWWNEIDDADEDEDEDEDENNDFRGTNGGGDNNENDDDDGDNEDKDDLRFLVGDAKDDDGNEVEEFGE